MVKSVLPAKLLFLFYNPPQSIRPINIDAAIPRGMVQRSIAPSWPRAPHMGVAIAILNGDEIDPMDAPTAKSCGKPGGRYSQQRCSLHLELAEKHDGYNAIPGKECSHPAGQRYKKRIEHAGINLQAMGKYPGDVACLFHAGKIICIAGVGYNLTHGSEQPTPATLLPGLYALPHTG